MSTPSLEVQSTLEVPVRDYPIEDEDRSEYPMELDFDLLRRLVETDNHIMYQTTRELTFTGGPNGWSVHGVAYWELLAEGYTRRPHLATEEFKRKSGKCTPATARSLLPARQRSAAHCKNDQGRTDEVWLDHFITIIVFPRLGSLGLPPFFYLRRHLNGHNFQTRDEIKTALEQVFKDQSPAFWRKDIHDLPKCRQKTIDASGAYLK
ncbi:hypothetical protein RB195_023248 [Necator americanus]